MKRLVLASASPRRKELLSLLQIPFDIEVSDVNEEVEGGLTPSQIVNELSSRKARAVFENAKDSIVIGSDTIVVIENEVLNKPVDEKDAYRMIRKLSGKTHSVYTGVTFKTEAKEYSFYEETKVTFWDLSDEDILEYIATNEPFDKAGAYGIQGFGATLVKRVEGEYATVVGLPIARLKQELKKFLSN